MFDMDDKQTWIRNLLSLSIQKHRVKITSTLSMNKFKVEIIHFGWFILITHFSYFC